MIAARPEKRTVRSQDFQAPRRFSDGETAPPRRRFKQVADEQAGVGREGEDARRRLLAPSVMQIGDDGEGQVGTRAGDRIFRDRQRHFASSSRVFVVFSISARGGFVNHV